MFGASPFGMSANVHLYLMQNHLGLIKIGKAVDVERRRKCLISADRCEIQIVHVLRNRGNREREYLALLRTARRYGEWFDGDECTRKTVRGLFDLPADVAWPFPLAADDLVDAWLNQLDRIRSCTSREKLSLRVIRDMENASTPDTSWHLNAKIWQIIWEYEQGCDPSIWHEEDGSTWVTRHSGASRQPLPFFTADLRSALLVWPERCRPTAWSGDAWSCCLEGLKARRVAMMKHNREVLSGGQLS